MFIHNKTVELERVYVVRSKGERTKINKSLDIHFIFDEVTNEWLYKGDTKLLCSMELEEINKILEELNKKK